MTWDIRSGVRRVLGTSAVVLSLSLAAAPLHARDDSPPASVSDADAAAWMKKLDIAPSSDAAKAYEAQAAARKQAEKDIRRLRLKHFGQLRNTQIRQEGILKLRQYTDPALFPLMIDVFAREQDDVRFAVLDILSESATPEGDATLAWQSLFGRDAILREEAASRLALRHAKTGEINERVKMVLYEGLKSKNETTLVRSANLADSLGIIEAIPWLAAAQLNAQPTGGSGSTVGLGAQNGALGWIVVGTQTAYVGDLEPVVSANAVAFDPQIATITSGVVMRVIDAVVLTYHIEVNTALRRLASRAWGEDVDNGWGYGAWRRWYKLELLPELERRKVEEARAASLAPAQPAPATGTVATPTTPPAPDGATTPALPVPKK